MADVKTDLGTRGPERFLRRQFNLAGVTPGGIITGGVQTDIELRPKDPWDYAQFGIIPWAQTSNIALLAAEHSYMEIPCVAGMGKAFDTVITRIKSTQPATVWLKAASIGDLAGLGGGALDTLSLPLGTVLSPLAWIVTGTAIAAAFTGNQAWLLAAGGEVALNVVIRSGTGGVVVVQNVNLAQAFDVSVMGYLIPVDMGGV